MGDRAHAGGSYCQRVLFQQLGVRVRSRAPLLAACLDLGIGQTDVQGSSLRIDVNYVPVTNQRDSRNELTMLVSAG